MTTVSASKRDSMDATTTTTTSGPDLTSKLASTTLSPTDTTTNPPPVTKSPTSTSTLTSLPLAIRKRIYTHLLDTEHVNVSLPNVSYTPSLPSSSTHLTIRSSRPPFPISASLFYINRALGAEALRFFYSKGLWVRLEVYSNDARHAKSLLLDSGILFSTAETERVERSTMHAMDLTILEKNSAVKRAGVMFPAQYLPRLINYLSQAGKTTGTWAPSHSLFINVLNTYDLEVAKLQGDLLELFRLLTNFGAVTIDSANLLPGYAEGLQTSMLAADFAAESFLDTVTGMAERAEEARGEKDWELSAQHAQSAIIALTYGFLTRAELLHSQPEEFVRKIQRLRWRCELCLGRSLSSLHESASSSASWLTSSPSPTASSPSSEEEQAQKQKLSKALLSAEAATSHALSLSTDSPSPSSNPWFQSLPTELIPPNKSDWFTDEERGLSWYACGIAHMAVGEYLFAAGDLERACGLFPGGEGFEKAFERAREGIDWSVKPGTGLKRAAKVVRG